MNTKVFFQRELAKLHALSELLGGDHGEAKTLGIIPAKNIPMELPLVSFQMGTNDRSKPLLAIIGGIHGLEFVGAQVALAMLESYIHLAHWDDVLKDMLTKVRLVFIPMANPWGLYMGRRANEQGIDLMRNAPIDATITSRYPLLSGHRLSKHLPWYRGPKHPKTSTNSAHGDEALEHMALESRLITRFLMQESHGRPFMISVDIHSGFGIHDRLWFPYAYSKKPFKHLGAIYRLKELMDEALPHHIYTIEPQSKQYTTHGDLWDYLFLCCQKKTPNTTYLPFSLEIGSWRWVRKNPWQIFSFFGMFNPIKPHRLRRTLRRHLPFFDFINRATLSWQNWAVSGNHAQAKSTNSAMKLWYEKHMQ